MPHTLKNKNLEIRIDLPFENYDNTRFDQTGKIVDVIFKGTEFSITERADDSDPNNFGRGFYNEFGLEITVDFHEVEIGDWFHKIGVGLLKKEGEDYSHMKRYEIRPANFEVKPEVDSIRMTCTSEESNGHSYTLHKEILLNGEGFQIHYELENTGNKEIITGEYVHNFMAIDHDLIGKNYKLKLPFELVQKNFSEAVNHENKVLINKEDFTFESPVQEPFFFSYLNGSKTVQATWELINHKKKLGIRETGNFLTEKVNLWGWTHVVSPELFFKIHLQPNESVKWNRKYELFDI